MKRKDNIAIEHISHKIKLQYDTVENAITIAFTTNYRIK